MATFAWARHAFTAHSRPSPMNELKNAREVQKIIGTTGKEYSWEGGEGDRTMKDWRRIY